MEFVEIPSLIFQVVDIRLVDLHLVLRQRSGLVRTNYGSRSHGLTGVHFADKIIRLQHTVHAEGQT